MYSNLSILKKRSEAIIILFLAVMILAVYWPVQQYKFINYDDTGYVTKNDLVRSGISVTGVKEAFYTFQMGNWHPLTMISHMLDWQLFGNKAGGHHWMSVIIHIFNTVLLFLFLRMATGTIWRSAFVAALFAVHPINVESVAWISERKNVLSTFFCILTMILYVWYTKSPDWKRYFPVLFSFSLGLMSKPMLVTLPFVLLLMDYWPLKRTVIKTRNGNQEELSALIVKKQKMRFLIIEKIPLFFLSAISAFITLYAQKAVSAVMALESFPIPYRIGNAVISYVSYIRKMFWPLDLAVFYPFNYTMSSSHVILGVLLIVAITIFVCIYFRRFPYFTVGWFWYLGTMIPVIGLVQVGSQAMADRYAYVPFIGLFVMLTWGLASYFKKIVQTKILIIIPILIISTLIIVTHLQLKNWRDSYTIFYHAVNVTKNNAFAHSALAGELLIRNQTKEAMIHAQKSLELNPKSYDTLIRLAWAYSNNNEPEKAIEALRKAIEINTKVPRAYDDIYNIYIRMGKKKEALDEYRNALKVNSNNPELYTKYGDALASQGYHDDAIMQYNEALRVKPDDISANYNLGMALLQKSDTEGALKQFQKVIVLQPQYADAHYQLAIILKKKGMIEESQRHQQEAKRLLRLFKDNQ
jgi:tetratricopeptide (TPR) repeat protein